MSMAIRCIFRLAQQAQTVRVHYWPDRYKQGFRPNVRRRLCSMTFHDRELAGIDALRDLGGGNVR